MKHAHGKKKSQPSVEDDERFLRKLAKFEPATTKTMVHLTRLNNQSFVVNADLIKFIENSPDTVITLLTGEKLVVLESVDEVLERIGEFQTRFHRRAGPGLVVNTSRQSDASTLVCELSTKKPSRDGRS